MPRYVITEVTPITGRPENWSEKCEREKIEQAAAQLGLQVVKVPVPKPAAPVQPPVLIKGK